MNPALPLYPPLPPQAIKYNQENPNQLPTTPTAQYVLTNIIGTNSHFSPHTTGCTRLVYTTTPAATAQYAPPSLSNNQALLPRAGAGVSLSNAVRNTRSHKTVYMIFIGHSASVNRSGKRETCPATARGRNAVRYRRSRRAIREKGIKMSRIAFSWTCHPNRKEA